MRNIYFFDSALFIQKTNILRNWGGDQKSQ